MKERKKERKRTKEETVKNKIKIKKRKREREREKVFLTFLKPSLYFRSKSRLKSRFVRQDLARSSATLVSFQAAKVSPL